MEHALRIFVGSIKPIVSEHTLPGALSEILLPVVIVVAIVSLLPTERSHGAVGADRTRA